MTTGYAMSDITPRREHGVSVVIVTRNAERSIGTCLQEVWGQNVASTEVVAVDSASTDRTVAILEQEYPRTRLLRQARNVGYRDGNIIGMAASRSRYVLLLNDDAVLGRDSLRRLISYMDDHPRVALATPMIVMSDDSERINTAGNRLTACGYPSCRGKGAPPLEFCRTGPVAAVSGCCFIARGSVLDEIGGFSTDFGAYVTGWHASLEDADLSARVWLAGYEVHYVAEAVVSHQYSQRQMSPERFASIEFGRHLLLLRNLHAATLLRLAPILVGAEAAAFIFALYRGRRYAMAKIKEVAWIMGHLRIIKDMRLRVQRLRTRPDRELMSLWDTEIELAGAIGGRAGVMIQAVTSMVLKCYQRALTGHFADFGKAR